MGKLSRTRIRIVESQDPKLLVGGQILRLLRHKKHFPNILRRFSSLEQHFTLTLFQFFATLLNCWAHELTEQVLMCGRMFKCHRMV